MYFACLTLGYLGTMMGVNNLHMGKYVSLVFLPNIWGGDVNLCIEEATSDNL